MNTQTQTPAQTFGPEIDEAVRQGIANAARAEEDAARVQYAKGRALRLEADLRAAWSAFVVALGREAAMEAIAREDCGSRDVVSILERAGKELGRLE